MFIKEHRNKSDESRKTGSTLFVCNASTSLTGNDSKTLEVYLKHLFRKFGEIEGVSVGSLADEEDAASKPVFAHVVFESKKSVKAALRAGAFSAEEAAAALEAAEPPPTGLEGIIHKYRSQRLSFEDIENNANIQMAAFEKMEEEEKLERERKRANPVDADGFTLVTYKKQAAPQPADGGEGVGRSGKKRGGAARGRTRNKKKTELTNFYRFQMREAKRDQLQELRRRFEEDKARVARLREGRRFKPF
uniref:Ribosomal RNA-processing protein 7 C-terminal domain-containing protein n=1 Tax=Heterosigma akashiwo TaxID=2829 RepID=A0A7S3XPT4_HETAK